MISMGIQLLAVAKRKKLWYNGENLCKEADMSRSPKNLILSLLALTVACAAVWLAMLGSRQARLEETGPLETEQTLPRPPENPYEESDFYKKDGFVYCSAVDAKVGVDVSAHQGRIDWQAVKEAGVDFAMIRVGYRGYDLGGIYIDECFEANMEGALAAGLDVGVYFYSQAISVTEALEEAELVLEAVEGYELTWPVVFDWECIGEAARTWDLSAKTVTACTAAFCDAVEKAGYIPAFYFNQSMSQTTFRLRELQQYDFWLAQYNEAMTFPYDVAMWQYTNRGTVPGIDVTVDLNLSFRDYGQETK